MFEQHKFNYLWLETKYVQCKNEAPRVHDFIPAEESDTISFL